MKAFLAISGLPFAGLAGFIIVSTSINYCKAEGERFALLATAKESYTNVVVTSSSATDLYFTHSRGIGNAKLRDLAPTVQKQFHFDSEKAATIQYQQTMENARFTKALQDAPRPVVKLDPDGVLSAQGASLSEEVADHRLYAKSFLNQPAPGLVVEKWLTEQPNIQGKFVLVDFWATWCGPCRKSIPHLNQLQARFKDRLTVIGISDESEQAVSKAVPSLGYAVAIDPTARMMRQVEVSGIPHALLIDPKGVVRFEGMPTYLTENALETLLNRFQ